MTRTALLAVATLATTLSGCAALEAHRVPGGPAGCKAVCEKWGMELTGMVQVGSDSDACVCGVKREGAPGASLGAGAAVAVAAVARLRGEERPEDLQGGADAAPGPGLIPKIRVELPRSAPDPAQPPEP